MTVQAQAIRPPLDLRRALEVEAWDALIERRLGDPRDMLGGHAARRLVQDLTAQGVAQLAPSPNPAMDAVQITIAGVRSPFTNGGASALLRNWQTAARSRLAEKG